MHPRLLPTLTRSRPVVLGRSISHLLRPTHAVDSLGLPLQPCPSPPPPSSLPHLTPSALLRLHKLSALTPPPIDSPEFETLRKEVEEMVGVVEEMRGLEVEWDGEGVPDGRIWMEGKGQDIDFGKLLETQKKFLEGSKRRVPGSAGLEAPEQEQAEERTAQAVDEDARLLGMAEEGKQRVKMKGLGKRPEEEAWYYVVRRGKREE